MVDMARSTLSSHSSATVGTSYPPQGESWALKISDKSQIWENAKSIEQVATPAPSQPLCGLRFIVVVFT